MSLWEYSERGEALAGQPRHADAVVDRLLSSPLFVRIQREEVVTILSVFEEARFDAGHRLTLQGLRGTDFFIIATGQAAVSIDGRNVALLGPGDFFGEVGVLSDGLRTATVTAATSLHCMVLPHAGLEALLKAHPELGINLLRDVLRRFRRLAASGHTESAR